MYKHLFAFRSFPLTWDENLQSFCNVTPNRVKLSLCSMPHRGGKLGVTPFLAIQSSMHLLVLSLTSVHSKNAFSTFCDSSTPFLRTVTRIELSSAYFVRSLSWQYWATSRSFKNRLNKYGPLTLPCYDQYYGGGNCDSTQLFCLGSVVSQHFWVRLEWTFWKWFWNDHATWIKLILSIANMFPAKMAARRGSQWATKVSAFPYQVLDS